ncbi:MAG: M14 family zinc carboxypeptidase [Myxococcota bacterium]|nr:M14 family zinc carboxypeptidase [Myxococcota bacterium]
MESIPFESTSSTQWGSWKTDPNQLALQQPLYQGKWNLWSPSDIQIQDGAVRVRVDVGKRPDLTLIGRTSIPESGKDELSGYGLSVERNEVVLYKWQSGMVEAISPAIQRGKPSTIDIHLEYHRSAIEGFVCRSNDNEQIGHVRIEDAGLRGNGIAIRVSKKQGTDTAITNLWYRNQPEILPSDSTIDLPGKRVLVHLPSGTSIPRPLRTFILEDPPQEGIWLLLPERKHLQSLGSALQDAGVLYGRIPYWARNKEYREWRESSPIPSQDGFRLNLSYKDPDMVEELLKAYHKRYPDITRLYLLGESRQRRPIWGLRITDNPQVEEKEPTVLLVAAHHGSELLAIEYVLDSIDQLLRGYQTQTKEWIDNIDIWAVPMVNVDGNYNYWHQDDESGRKNSWDINDDGIISHREGVDLNRNYPFQWGSLGEIGSRSWIPSYSYRGESAASEPEVQAILRWAKRYQPTAVLSWHTSGNMILSPYTIDNIATLKPDIPWKIAEHLIKDIPPFSAGRRSTVVMRKIYSVDGVDQDWHFHHHGAMAYIIEGTHYNPTDLRIRDRSVRLYRPITDRLLHRVAKGPAIRVIVEDEYGFPLRAQITLKSIQQNANEDWHTRTLDGRWDFLLDKPAKHRIQIQADGYRPVNVTVKSDRLYRIRLKKP